MVYDKTVSKHLDAIKRTSKRLMKLIEKYENSDYCEVPNNKLELEEFISDIKLKEVLSGFAQNKNLVVLESIAKNQYTPAKKLKELEQHNNCFSIKKNIALNSSTPIETLKMLNTKGYEKYIALNSNTLAKTLMLRTKEHRKDIELNVNTAVETFERYENNNNNNNKKLIKKIMKKLCLRN